MTSRAVRAIALVIAPVALVGACNELSGAGNWDAVDPVDAGIDVVESGPAEVPEASAPEDAADTGEPVIQPKRVFVTEKVYSGNLGGRPGADEKCRQAALGAALTGKWFAWLSITNKPAIERITYDGPYQLVTGVEVVANKAQLMSGALSHAINFNEHGVEYPDNRGVWTGTRGDGTIDATCSNWTDGTVLQLGTMGSAVAMDNGWTKGAAQPNLADNWECSTSVALYCFEE